jgi:uncharacterized heparinase superfamily protein
MTFQCHANTLFLASLAHAEHEAHEVSAGQTHPSAKDRVAQSPLRPRPVFCVIEHAYRDRAVADAVCRGRFTHAGITLDLGVEPEWLTAAFPADEEWRIEWSKFYYGLHLAHAFVDTGEPRFLETWQRLVHSWIRQVPVDYDSSDVLGRRIQNWLYAWNLFATAPPFSGFTPEFTRDLVASVTVQVQYLRANLTPERNHRTLELYALLIAALALPQLDDDGTLLSFAMAELEKNVLSDIWPDGVHRECSIHYHAIVLRSLLGAWENARRFGLSFSSAYATRVERAAEFLLYFQRPDGTIPSLSDSDTGNYTDVLALAATLLGRPDLLYGATAGLHGLSPQRRYVDFTHGGYFVQRSGWGADSTAFAEERFLIFDCGPLGDGGHGHYDLLNVEVAAGGRSLVIDPGRYTYDEETPNWRRWFKGTAAHNTVCVDGLDQTPYRRGKAKKAVAQGRLSYRLSAPGFDLVSGDVVSPQYDAIHARDVIFVAGEYWLIADRLQAERPHQYDLRFHLTPEAWGQTAISKSGENVVVQAPGLALVFPANVSVVLEPGWVAPTYGEKQPAPVVSVVRAGCSHAEFFSLLVPLASQSAVPTLRVASVSSASSVRVVEVDGVGPGSQQRDRMAWSPTAAPLTVGALRCRARRVGARRC